MSGGGQALRWSQGNQQNEWSRYDSNLYFGGDVLCSDYYSQFSEYCFWQ